MGNKAAQNALLSVYDKTGIEEFARQLHELGWTIYASGGTYKAIDAAGVPCLDVATLVGGKAILGHKVVTLSREIGAGLLADLSDKNEMNEMKKLGLPVIHLVCQDSYPLEETISQPGAGDGDVLLQSDIGGPTMLREAAKGRRIVLSVPEQRQEVISWLRAGRPDEKQFVDRLAARATYEVARYTMIEASYWNGINLSGHIALLDSPTKYGENPQQKEAAFYADKRIGVDPLGLDQFQHVKGWEKSFVNMTDIDRLLQTVTHIAAGFARSYKRVPSIAVGVKHGNACGAAVSDSLLEAVQKMLEGDTRAIHGGVVMVNGALSKEVAEALMRHAVPNNLPNRLLDGVVAASVEDAALEILKRAKLRVVINPALANLTEASLDVSRRQRQVRGGYLEQPNYTHVLDLGATEVEQFGKVTEQQRKDMILGWAVGSTSNSNTITLVKNGQLIGNGVGQQDRVGAGQLALSRTTVEGPTITKDAKHITLTITLDARKVKGAVAYSDSFFPFADGPQLLVAAGISAILTSKAGVNYEAIMGALQKEGVGIITIPDTLGRGFYQH